MKKIISFLFIFSLFIGFSQQKELTIEDAVLSNSKGLNPSTLNNLQWIKNADIYVYLKNDELVFTDVKSTQILRTIALSELQKTYPSLKRFPSLIEITNSELTFRYENNVEVYNYLNSLKSSSISFDRSAENNEYNSKAKAVAYTIENNLCIGTISNPKIAVTSIENKEIVSGQSIHRNEFGIKKGTFWSPNGNYLAFYQKDESNVTNYPLVDINTYPASLKNIKYPMAGQGSEKAKIGIYNIKTQQLIYLDIDTSDEHYLTNLSWSPDEKYLLLAEVNRGQNQFYFNRYNAETGKKVNTLFEEANEKWTEPEHDAIFLPNSTTNFLWMSLRDGFWNIYQYSTDGKLIKQLTNFKWVVTEILGFDSNGQNVIIAGTGDDARESHTFKVNLKTGKYIALTTEKGTHNIQLSDNGNYLIDSFNSLTIPNNINIIDTNKGKISLIYIAKNPLKEYKIGTTEFITLKGNDGTDLYAKITKPADFDPSKKYPILIYVYGGPHAQLVTNSWLAGSSLWMPAFATLENYIVFTLDNRGSAHRGYTFESAIHRKLGDVEMEDQITGVNYLKSLNYVDSKRIALNGWSYGGFMTSSLMLRNPGIFTTAVAGGPVTDWKYYEIMYGERYMDTPQENPAGYEKAKVHNYIKNLKGKLMLVIGSIDPTVVPQHSMTLLQEAIKQKVQIDFFSYPMHEHNVHGIDRVHLIKKMMDYTVKNNK
jgi:dipeptidyl-peptidase-4